MEPVHPPTTAVRAQSTDGTVPHHSRATDDVIRAANDVGGQPDLGSQSAAVVPPVVALHDSNLNAVQHASTLLGGVVPGAQALGGLSAGTEVGTSADVNNKISVASANPQGADLGTQADVNARISVASATSAVGAEPAAMTKEHELGLEKVELPIAHRNYLMSFGDVVNLSANEAQRKLFADLLYFANPNPGSKTEIKPFSNTEAFVTHFGRPGHDSLVEKIAEARAHLMRMAAEMVEITKPEQAQIFLDGFAKAAGVTFTPGQEPTPEQIRQVSDFAIKVAERANHSDKALVTNAHLATGRPDPHAAHEAPPHHLSDPSLHRAEPSSAPLDGPKMLPSGEVQNPVAVHHQAIERHHEVGTAHASGAESNPNMHTGVLPTNRNEISSLAQAAANPAAGGATEQGWSQHVGPEKSPVQHATQPAGAQTGLGM